MSFTTRLANRVDAMSTRPMAVLLVMLGLTGFAISQPLLEVLGSEPTFFAFRNIEGWDLVWFALAVALVPPLVLWLATLAVTALSRTAGLNVLVAFVIFLAALTAIQLVKSIGSFSPLIVGILAAAIGIAVGAAFIRFDAARTWAQFTAVLPVIAVVGFLFTSETSDLLHTPEGPEPSEAASETPAADMPDVVMIVFDEISTLSMLDADREIDAVRYPHFADFADDATWYRDFTTNAMVTVAALPTLLTGNDPIGEAPTQQNYPENLFTLLEPTHHLTVFESPTAMCTMDSCGEGGPDESPQRPQPRYHALFDDTLSTLRERVSLSSQSTQDLADFEERLEENADALTANEEDDPLGALRSLTPTRLLDFVDTFTPRSDPTLYFLHLLLPHVPYRFYEDGSSYSVPPNGDFANTSTAQGESRLEWPVTVMEQRYQLQASFTDQLLGLIIDKLELLGMYDDSLVVVLGDHGLSFDPASASYRAVTDEGADPDGISGTAFAPLLIKAPHQDAGRLSDENLMSIDIVPTIADMLGIEIPWPVAGAPAGSELVADRGNAKYMIESRGFARAIEILGRFDFEADSFRPTSADQQIAAIGPDDPAVRGLYETLESSEVIEQSFDDIVAGKRGSAVIPELDLLEQPPPNAPPRGVVIGQIEGAGSDGEVIFAVNGTVVAASPQFDSGESLGLFTVVLNRDTLVERNTIEMAVATADGYLELDVVAG